MPSNVFPETMLKSCTCTEYDTKNGVFESLCVCVLDLFFQIQQNLS